MLYPISAGSSFPQSLTQFHDNYKNNAEKPAKVLTSPQILRALIGVTFYVYCLYFFLNRTVIEVFVSLSHSIKK